MTAAEFKKQISEGIPSELPGIKPYDFNLNHAPKRKDILNSAEKKLAIKNALRYFPEKFHPYWQRNLCRNFQFMEEYICTGSDLTMR